MELPPSSLAKPEPPARWQPGGGGGGSSTLQGQQRKAADCTKHAKPAANSGSNVKRLTAYKKKSMAISCMEQELASKLQLARQLELEHSRLQAEHQLLVECCDGLQLLRLRQEPGAALDLEQEELELLQQLQNIPYSRTPPDNASRSGSGDGQAGDMQEAGQSLGASAAYASVSAAAAAVAPEDPTQERFSPANDVMFYYRHLLSLPPCPGADTVTVCELVADFASTVQQLALQLHLLGRPRCITDPQEGPVQRIKALLHRHLHIMATLALLQRTEVIEGFMLTNFETGEPFEEHPIQKHVWALQQLDLSQQQVVTISRAMGFFERLLAPILEERQQLQREITLQKEEEGSSGGGTSSNHKQRMAQQEAMLLRLSSLLRKEYMVRFAVCSGILGSLTYIQMATLAVQMTPHPVSLQLLGMIVLQQYQQQQQQQQTHGATGQQRKQGGQA